MSPVDERPRSDGRSPAFWRSIDELADAPEFRRFVEREFPAYADQMLTPPTRRNFLKIMGASLALAGMTGCRWPEEEILPFAHRPAGYTPGSTQRFATSIELLGSATGLLVTSYDGRPIKIEGNPESWSSRGATGVWHQASILELYDPERSQHVVRRGSGPQSRGEFLAFARDQFDELRDGGGRGLRVLAAPGSSPSREQMRQRLAMRLPDSRWYEYSPVSRDTIREGARLALGRPVRTHLSLDRAETILSIDEDFLTFHPAAVRYARDFAAGRDPHGGFARLWVVESRFSLTGGMADRRIPLKPSAIPAYVTCLAAAVLAQPGVSLPSGASGLVSTLAAARNSPAFAAFDLRVAEELARHRGRSIVTAGPSQPPEVHALVHVINSALSNVGQTVYYTQEPEPDRIPHPEAIRELAEEIVGGRVDTLVILDGNPAYDAPRELELAALIESVPTAIHLSTHFNETSIACSWHVPQAHYLESWGDGRDYRGGVGIRQPLIRPLFDGRSEIELLATWIDDEATTGYDIVRRTFFGASAGRDEKSWANALHDGYVADSEWSPLAELPIRAEWGARLERHLVAPESAAGRLELTCVEDSKVLDGRFANNGWLQEMPDPLTKLTWDNAALVAPATVAKLGARQGGMIRLAAAERVVEPALVKRSAAHEKLFVAAPSEKLTKEEAARKVLAT
ncbi:MAG TPA: TAT-variant-translocated molybdopterin oxidoreductase, partial [Candidatus Polarisedimenticolaceae bacterium]|nr:TAT-variant-translocated molybdopterin oxidoreductase [Candidatus Polarisedimenticolaceae bacterium]